MELLNITKIKQTKTQWPLKILPGTVWLCVGEAGSGKTELALNLAFALRRQTDGPVRLFDMDSTKAAFRTRDFRHTLNASGIAVHMNSAMLDSPVVPDGLPEALGDENGQTVLDVGGNLVGTLCLGQFAEKLQSDRTVVMYLFNPYRALGRSADELRRIRTAILDTIGAHNYILVANPAMGEETDSETWRYGLNQVSNYFPDERIMVALAPEELDVSDAECPVFGIRRWIPEILTRKE